MVKKKFAFILLYKVAAIVLLNIDDKKCVMSRNQSGNTFHFENKQSDAAGFWLITDLYFAVNRNAAGIRLLLFRFFYNKAQNSCWL